MLLFDLLHKAICNFLSERQTVIYVDNVFSFIGKLDSVYSVLSVDVMVRLRVYFYSIDTDRITIKCEVIEHE